MKQVPHVSEAEWEVMPVLWHTAPIRVGALIENLSASTTWNPNTIKTLGPECHRADAQGIT